eukprot:scaffold3978_cov291-Pinguiococcus_pyrenoidosus.AAC.11
MLYVEQPAGVGFSVADDDAAYNTNDKTAAEDNYLLIQAFLERFPDFRANDFYITSESYGGHYMPTLALQILKQNPPAGAPKRINFKGMAVGNPYTQAFSNNVSSSRGIRSASRTPDTRDADRWRCMRPIGAISSYPSQRSTNGKQNAPERLPRRARTKSFWICASIWRPR